MVEVSRKTLPRDSIMCVLVAVHGQVPCVGQKCIFPLRLRPHFSDYNVLRQLFERVNLDFLDAYDFDNIMDAGKQLRKDYFVLGNSFHCQKRTLVKSSCPQNNVFLA